MERKIKAQSAMEYLMTYGWAILIIAIVLAALFSLGVFSSNSFLGTTCIASSGFLCSNPILHGGILTATIGQATGTSWSSVTLCFVPSNGIAPTGSSSSCTSPDVSNTVGNLASGQSVQVTFNLQNIVSTAPGATATGTIWAIYNSISNGGPYDVQMATVTAKQV